MITHRLSTNQTPEPTVRFYKFIALTFLIATVVLLGVVIFVTTKKAEITVVAKEDNRGINLAVMVGENGGDKVIKGIVTSTVFAWSEKFQPTGSKKSEGVATGEVIIYNKSNAAQPLVKTTRLLTPDGILFRLTQGVVVPANGEIKAEVYADKSGAESDIGPAQFIIPGLNIDKQKMVYAESKQAMMGGMKVVGVLSAEDLQNAENSYKEKVKDAFLASLAPAQEGEERIVTVTDSKTNIDKKAKEEVSEFTVSGSSNIVLVTYNTNELLDLVNREAESKIDLTAERFLAASRKPTVEVGSYNLKEGTAELTVRQNVTVTLDANVEKLSPSNFLGKKKDEIERYILSLDHVAGVEVKFSPAWMLSAPTVPDKIRVVVKNVE